MRIWWSTPMPIRSLSLAPGRTRREVCLPLPTWLVAWKKRTFVKKCAVFWKEAKRHFASALGGSEYALSDNEGIGKGRLNPMPKLNLVCAIRDVMCDWK